MQVYSTQIYRLFIHIYMTLCLMYIRHNVVYICINNIITLIRNCDLNKKQIRSACIVLLV